MPGTDDTTTPANPAAPAAPTAPVVTPPAPEAPTAPTGPAPAVAPAPDASGDQVIAATAAAAIIEDKDWAAGAIVVANGSIPDKTGKRPVIVVEHWDPPVVDADGALKDPATLKIKGYPAGADLYYRTDPSVEFPKDALIVTLGVDVQQGLLWGLSPDVRFVHVGPASAVYGGVNLAYSRGARDIAVHGLTDEEKARLQPWFDAAPTHYQAPAPDVVITLK